MSITQLTPVEYSFGTRALVGVHYERFCAVVGLTPTEGGWGFLHCVDSIGRRVTAVTDDVPYLKLMIEAADLSGLQIPEGKFEALRMGWPDDWAGIKSPDQPGRNDPCPCGSGKKYKVCHGKAAQSPPYPRTTPTHVLGTGSDKVATVAKSTDMRTAYHEAGHVVAAVFLGRGVRRATIIGDEKTDGLVQNHRRGANWMERLEEADFASCWGGFIDGRTRRAVETEIMISLAGGLVEMQALGLEHHEAGMGLVRLSSADSAAMAKAHGGLESDWHNLIMGGDYGNALELAIKVSGGDEEGAAYFDWLEQRTRSLIRRFDFWPTVEDVAVALRESRELSGRRISEVIAESYEIRNKPRLDAFKRMVERGSSGE